MASGTRSRLNDRHPAAAHRAKTAREVLAIAGGIFSLLGAGLVLISALSEPDSSFDIVAGAGMILSGILLARRNMIGAWLYLAVFAATLIWSLTNVGPGGPSFGYRLAGPGLLLIMMIVLAPFFTRRSRRRVGVTCVAIFIATLTVDLLSAAANEPQPASLSFAAPGRGPQ